MLYNWSNRTLLIAEDDEMNYKYLQLIFSRFTKINIIWAINGQMAIDCCKIYSHIDVVLMDLQLPVIDGMEAARQIKQNRPELPVIAHTANNNPAEIFAGSEKTGFDDFIAKPANYGDILGKVDEVLQRAKTSVRTRHAVTFSVPRRAGGF